MMLSPGKCLVAVVAICALDTACARTNGEQEKICVEQEPAQVGVRGAEPRPALPRALRPEPSRPEPLRPEPLSADIVAQLRENCPAALDATDVEVALSDGGIILTFTTDSGDVEDLRRRVRHMGDMYAVHDSRYDVIRWHRMDGDSAVEESGGARAGLMGGDMPGMRAIENERDHMPTVNVAVVDLLEGAEILLTPVEESQLDVLRVRGREHHARLSEGGCWTLWIPMPDVVTPGTAEE